MEGSSEEMERLFPRCRPRDLNQNYGEASSEESLADRANDNYGEDRSVVSAYEASSYRRIEIAGGRELFSSTRKKHRFSADVMYDDKLRRYMFSFGATSPPPPSQLRKSSSLDSRLVYEAPVRNAEVVYDDIGGELLRVKSPADSPMDTESEPASPPRRRLIGNVPIAEYEGSPRRYGLPPPPQQNGAVDEEDEFSELEYRLYRVNAGSSYVGRRLARDTATESPNRLPNEQELLLLHEGVHRLSAADLDSSSYPETEVGEQVGERNFTLSPETTDCDSNDIESVLSLGAGPAGMPVLEDGLSSGHTSDDEQQPPYLWSSDLSYFDSLAQKAEETSPRLQSDNGLPDECPNGKGNVSEAIKEIKQAIQMSKNVQLKSTHSGNNCDGPIQPVWVPRLSQSSKLKDGEVHGERNPDEDCDTDQETDRLLGAQRTDDKGFYDEKNRNSTGKKKSTSKEVLIEGVLFRARYLGSTQLVCEGQPTKATRMMQAEEAVSRIKAPEGETQPSTEVDLFISTEKIMVLNTDLKEIMMDHALRAISYIADIGDLVVLMARRRVMNSPDDPSEPKIKRTPKMICHVFESEEAQFIAQSIGQAFQVAYMEFLKANGIEDSSFVKEMDYQEVLNSQEIFGNELEMFAKKEKQKEVVVPKQKGEILGMVIVESGWGSMLPTVVIANMAQSGPAARCGQLNIGDQIIAINGISLVGLPLSTCQNYIKNTKNQTVVKLTVVPCAPVVEVKIKRPDTKYQLGFSVQNGVICSLLRGGIAERGGVRVGHRIIEINGQSVVAVPHEKIVNLLATSVGEIHMKTMPTSMFRLLTGQESPLYI